MEKIVEVAKWCVANWQNALAAVNMVVLGLVGIFMLIPGDQPEKSLKAVADFLAKFSKKPKDPQ